MGHVNASRAFAAMTQPSQQLSRSNTMPSGSRALPRTRHSIGAFDADSIPKFSEQTLYSHPSVKIVKFELPQTVSTKPILPDLDYPVDAIETLPWKVSTERIASLGALKIENIASATFLKAGSVIQALLRNCQGWCVDGKSIFVLRIRKLTYYRIELPDETDQDKERVENLKEVLSTIIRYEVTPCPFQRGFSVELPPEAKTPKRKKAWTPKHSPNTGLKKLDFGDRAGDGGERDTSDLGSIGEESDHSISQASVASFPRPSSSRALRSSPISIPRRATSGPVTEPLKPFGSLVAQFQDVSSSTSETDDVNPASSVDSFHSFQDTSSLSIPPLYSTPPSPSNSHFIREDQQIPLTRGHSRDLSGITITAEPSSSPKLEPAFEPCSLTQSRSTNAEIDDAPQLATTSSSSQGMRAEDANSAIRRRLRTSRKRELSPLPHSSTLLNPSPRSPGRGFAAAVLHKACTLVLGPPVQLLLMVLRYAANVAAKDNESDSIHRTSREIDEGWNEDDFGMPLSPRYSRRHPNYAPNLNRSVG